jgi:hypothetical protein
MGVRFAMEMGPDDGRTSGVTVGERRLCLCLGELDMADDIGPFGAARLGDAPGPSSQALARHVEDRTLVVLQCAGVPWPRSRRAPGHAAQRRARNATIPRAMA